MEGFGVHTSMWTMNWDRDGAEKAVAGAVRYNVDFIEIALMNAPADELRRAYVAIGAGLDDGALRPLIGRELPLAEAARAHREIMEPGSAGKIVLLP